MNRFHLICALTVLAMMALPSCDKQILRNSYITIYYDIDQLRAETGECNDAEGKEFWTLSVFVDKYTEAAAIYNDDRTSFDQLCVKRGDCSYDGGRHVLPNIAKIAYPVDDFSVINIT